LGRCAVSESEAEDKPGDDVSHLLADYLLGEGGEWLWLLLPLLAVCAE
jgi:hypothetical protein